VCNSEETVARRLAADSFVVADVTGSTDAHGVNRKGKRVEKGKGDGKKPRKRKKNNKKEIFFFSRRKGKKEKEEKKKEKKRKEKENYDFFPLIFRCLGLGGLPGFLCAASVA
jgi:hypothetical protein